MLSTRPIDGLFSIVDVSCILGREAGSDMPSYNIIDEFFSMLYNIVLISLAMLNSLVPISLVNLLIPLLTI